MILLVHNYDDTSRHPARFNQFVRPDCVIQRAFPCDAMLKLAVFKTAIEIIDGIVWCRFRHVINDHSRKPCTGEAMLFRSRNGSPVR